MKKLLALFIVFLMLLAAFPACAEDYTLTAGTYIIGRDIEPGAYELDININGVCNLRNPDGTIKDDLYRFDTYNLEDGYQLQVDLMPVKLKRISISAEQAESKHYKKLLDARLAAEEIEYVGVDALRYALPSGTYTVGTDIPAGSWQVQYFSIRDCTFTIVHGYKRTSIIIVSPKANHYDPSKSVATAYVPLYEGDTVIIGDTIGGLFLIPYSRDLSDW